MPAINRKVVMAKLEKKAIETLQSEGQGLMQLASKALQEKNQASLFFSIHTLKGLAGLSGQTHKAQILHQLEEELMAAQKKQKAVDWPLLSATLQGLGTSFLYDEGQVLFAPGWQVPWQQLAHNLDKEVALFGPSTLPLFLSQTMRLYIGALTHHLLANAICHGVEKKEHRGQKAKALQGQIMIELESRPGLREMTEVVALSVCDDGQGWPQEDRLQTPEKGKNLPLPFWASGRGMALESINAMSSNVKIVTTKSSKSLDSGLFFKIEMIIYLHHRP